MGNQKKWDGRISNISISPDGQPELYEELAKISSRARTERLRSLALVGLLSVNSNSQRGNSSIKKPEQEQELEENKDDENKLNFHKNQLKSKLIKSV